MPGKVHPEAIDVNALRLQVFNAGWVRRSMMRNGDGTITLEFRDAPNTEDWGGMVTRNSTGKTEAEALQKLLDQIKKETESVE